MAAPTEGPRFEPLAYSFGPSAFLPSPKVVTSVAKIRIEVGVADTFIKITATGQWGPEMVRDCGAEVRRQIDHVYAVAWAPVTDDETPPALEEDPAALNKGTRRD